MVVGGRVWIGMGAGRCMEAQIDWAAAEIFSFSKAMDWAGWV